MAKSPRSGVLLCRTRKWLEHGEPGVLINDMSFALGVDGREPGCVFGDAGDAHGNASEGKSREVTCM